MESRFGFYIGVVLSGGGGLRIVHRRMEIKKNENETEMNKKCYFQRFIVLLGKDNFIYTEKYE